MKKQVFFLCTLTIICGCKKNSVEPSTNESTNSSKVVIEPKFIMATPKSTYNYHDTLSGEITAYNISNSIDTILTGNTAGMWSFSLKDDSGRVVIDGPHAFSNLLGFIIIKPGDSSIVNWINLGAINKLITDSTTYRHYTFQMGLYNNSILLSEDILIQ